MSASYKGLSVLLLLAVAMTVLSPVEAKGKKPTPSRAPLGFMPYCDSGDCPKGPYQSTCPVCGQLHYGSSTTLLQCFCFNSNRLLQDVTFIRDAQKCKTISANGNGDLVCGGSGRFLKGNNNNNGGSSTPSPTAAVGHVNFQFNCADGNCPSGDYKGYCARCVAENNPKPPNDPRPTLACRCFDESGVMTAKTSTMWNFQLCPKIVAKAGGLACIGASKNSGVRVYTGRRLEGKNLDELVHVEESEFDTLLEPETP